MDTHYLALVTLLMETSIKCNYSDCLFTTWFGYDWFLAHAAPRSEFPNTRKLNIENKLN